MGAVAISTGSVVTTMPSVQMPPICPEVPINEMARVKISFPRDPESLAVSSMEGIEDWAKLGTEIVQAYNNVSAICYETYQRQMLNCSHQYSSYNNESDLIDTYWESFVTCNSSCPTGDPLFGVDAIDPLLPFLQILQLYLYPQLLPQKRHHHS